MLMVNISLLLQRNLTQVKEHWNLYNSADGKWKSCRIFSYPLVRYLHHTWVFTLLSSTRLRRFWVPWDPEGSRQRQHTQPWSQYCLDRPWRLPPGEDLAQSTYRLQSTHEPIPSQLIWLTLKLTEINFPCSFCHTGRTLLESTCPRHILALSKPKMWVTFVDSI